MPSLWSPRRRRPDLETAVAEVWQEVLDQPVGPRDNFFDLGGNSLDAVRIVVRIEALLDVEVDVGSLFETLTVADMSARLRSRLDGAGPYR